MRRRNGEVETKSGERQITLGNGLRVSISMKDGAPDLHGYQECHACRGTPNQAGPGFSGGWRYQWVKLEGGKYLYARCCPECVYGALLRSYHPAQRFFDPAAGEEFADLELPL